MSPCYNISAANIVKLRRSCCGKEVREAGRKKGRGDGDWILFFLFRKRSKN